MNTDIKQAMHVEAAKSFGTAEANENERRWTDDKIDIKNQAPANHYDKSRRHLNFEIGPDGEIHPLGYHERSLEVRLMDRLTALGWVRSRPTARFSRTAVPDSSSAATTAVLSKWPSEIMLSIPTKMPTTATCTDVRRLHIGQRMCTVGVYSAMDRRTSSVFRYTSTRAVPISTH